MTIAEAIAMQSAARLDQLEEWRRELDSIIDVDGEEVDDHLIQQAMELRERILQKRSELS